MRHARDPPGARRAAGRGRRRRGRGGRQRLDRRHARDPPPTGSGREASHRLRAHPRRHAHPQRRRPRRARRGGRLRRRRRAPVRRLAHRPPRAVREPARRGSRWPRPAALRGRPPRLVGRRPRHLPRRLRPRPRARRPGRAPVVRLAARPQPRRPPRRAPRRRRLQPPPRPPRGPAERGRGERPLLPAPRARPRDPLRAGRRRGASGGPRTPPPALVLPAPLLDPLVRRDERARPPPPAEGRRSPPLALPPACLPPSLPAAGRAGSGARARRVRAPRGARLPARHPALGASARAAGPDGGRRVSEPHVSVVIPVFNAGDYLARALDSVARQTYRDFETVIVDDGSTDRRTLAILEAAAREPGVTVHRTPNGGPSRARNLGVERARGAYVLPLDADDYLASTFLAKTVPLLDADPALGVVYTWLALVGGHHGVWRTGGFSVTDLLSRCTIHVSSLYRRKIWEDVGGYDPRFVESCEDWGFWLGAAKRGWTGRCVPEVLVHYRRSPASRERGSRAPGVSTRLMRSLVAKHRDLYVSNLEDAMAGLYERLAAAGLTLERIYDHPAMRVYVRLRNLLGRRPAA